jgi:hypothetical protein
MRESLAAFESMTIPGAVKMLPFVWSEDETWKLEAFAGDDTRTERLDTPQYQSDEDRTRAESAAPAEADECPVCAQWSGATLDKQH